MKTTVQYVKTLFENYKRNFSGSKPVICKRITFQRKLDLLFSNNFLTYCRWPQNNFDDNFKVTVSLETCIQKLSRSRFSYDGKRNHVSMMYMRNDIGKSYFCTLIPLVYIIDLWTIGYGWLYFHWQIKCEEPSDGIFEAMRWLFN